MGDIVVISDVHIGDNTSTCWYQTKHHERRLIALLDWAIKNEKSIDEFIILGDLFDFWTYPPDVVPPTLDDILQANPNLFSIGSGAFSRLLTALPDRVKYIRGNHDINITESDIGKISNGKGQFVRMEPDLYLTRHDKQGKKMSADDFSEDYSRIVFSHGHIFTMFNAPDPPLVPVGYFVTRLIAHKVFYHLLKPGQTAANLRKNGAPEFRNLVSSKAINSSIPGTLLDAMARWANFHPDAPIRMPGPSGLTYSINQAKTLYKKLWSRWATGNGGGLKGHAFAYKAALSDLNGDFMGWNAQRIAFQAGASLAVMGHTHSPKNGWLKRGFVEYINTGDERPPEPEKTTSHFNFAVIGVGTRPRAALGQVTPNETVTLDHATADWTILGKANDYSCYVYIKNDSPYPLKLLGYDELHGYFAVEPHDLIPNNGRVVVCWMQDFPGTVGTEGVLRYQRVGGSGSEEFSFTCPTLSSNHCASGSETKIETRVGHSKTWENGIVKKGHPFSVSFTVT